MPFFSKQFGEALKSGFKAGGTADGRPVLESIRVLKSIGSRIREFEEKRIVTKNVPRVENRDPLPDPKLRKL